MGRDELRERIAPYRGVVLDIGTGDGKFVYRMARADPERFYIGVDASPANLGEAAAKIARKPAKGGLPNALYVIANVEQLPSELEHSAERIHINFPWGSLLDGLVLGDAVVLANLARVAAPPARLEILINYAVFAEPAPLAIADLPEINLEYIDTTLAPLYARAGMMIRERGFLGPEAMKQTPTSWSRRLAAGKHAQTVMIRADVELNDARTPVHGSAP